MQLYRLVCLQGSRLDDQRCAPPSAAKGPTVPDEDFFSLILRSQAKRMDEQRVHLPSTLKGPDTSWRNRPVLYSSTLGVIFVCWKNIHAFLQKTAISSFVPFLIVFCINSSSITLMTSSYGLPAAFSSVWDTDYRISLLTASSLWTLIGFFFLSRYSHCWCVGSTTVSIQCKT